jgi:hypothetical protein
MKQLRIEVCLCDVALVLSQEFPVEVPSELETIVKAGMSSQAYRGGASKAFKGLSADAKNALPFEDKVRRITEAMPTVGLTVISADPYVAPEKESGAKTAAKLLAGAKAKGMIDHLVMITGYEGDVNDEPAFLAAIAKWHKNPAA